MQLRLDNISFIVIVPERENEIWACKIFRRLLVARRSEFSHHALNGLKVSQCPDWGVGREDHR